MRPRVSLTVHPHGVALLAHGPDGLAAWSGFYRWDTHGADTVARALRDVPAWLAANAAEVTQ